MESGFGIGFESQIEPRGCGAACLAMAYRALGQIVPQAEIWPLVARRNAFGSVASTTHLMVGDAHKRGFEAVAVQARDPLGLLRACTDAGVQAILHLRYSADDRSGHYVLLLDIDSHYVRLHDPKLGPDRMLLHQELIDLWQPALSVGEVTGNMLIAIAPAGSDAEACAVCRTPIPQTIDCPRCHALVKLRPSAALGCSTATCAGRLWERVCCPQCDLLWGASPRGASPEPVDTPSRTAENGPDPAKLFAALDKFQAATAAVPGISATPEIGRLLGSLVDLRERLRVAIKADIVARADVAAKQQELADSIAKQVSVTVAQSPPTQPLPASRDAEEIVIDANELSRALLLRVATLS